MSTPGRVTEIPLAQATAEDLAPFTTLRRRKDLERAARFVAEGAKVVERLLDAPHPIESMLLTPAWRDRVLPRLVARGDVARLIVAPDREAIEDVTGFADRAGVKVLARRSAGPGLDALLERGPAPRLWLALDGVSNAENVGVVVRNAAAFGVQGLLIGETTCSPFLTRAIGASMAASLFVPVVEDVPLVAALGYVRRAGVRCVAAHPGAHERHLPDARLDGDVCLVFGAEGDGLSDAVRVACDEEVSVPMPPNVDSLNVGSAAAVFLYEAWRQRRRHG